MIILIILVVISKGLETEQYIEQGNKDDNKREYTMIDSTRTKQHKHDNKYNIDENTQNQIYNLEVTTLQGNAAPSSPPQSGATPKSVDGGSGTTNTQATAENPAGDSTKGGSGATIPAVSRSTSSTSQSSTQSTSGAAANTQPADSKGQSPQTSPSAQSTETSGEQKQDQSSSVSKPTAPDTSTQLAPQSPASTSSSTSTNGQSLASAVTPQSTTSPSSNKPQSQSDAASSTSTQGKGQTASTPTTDGQPSPQQQ
ncbi:hypothetical protein ENUP19_0051G0001 [Entamoeba nuttalli]|uniref:Uncharacterized protein n=1 Tax=Entamoeba nuttalli TaxID=412467 RepID=A0ABQ0DBT7_9EUKA